MKNSEVKFNTSKLAKIKGFDWYVASCYNDNQELADEDGTWMNFNKFPTEIGGHLNLYSAPKQTQLQEWLREEHQIFVEVIVDKTCEPKFSVSVHQFYGNPKDLTEREWGWNENCCKESQQYLYRTYEDALEEGLFAALNLIKK